MLKVFKGVYSGGIALVLTVSLDATRRDGRAPRTAAILRGTAPRAVSAGSGEGGPVDDARRVGGSDTLP